MQTNGSKGESTPEELANAKKSLRREQQRLADELDRYLAGDYGIDADNAKKAKDYEKWRTATSRSTGLSSSTESCETAGSMSIIGNPPYVEYSKVRKDLSGEALCHGALRQPVCSLH